MSYSVALAGDADATAQRSTRGMSPPKPEGQGVCLPVRSGNRRSSQHSRRLASGALHNEDFRRIDTMTACHDTSSWGPANEVGQTHFRRIVVGVDGSTNSVAALRLAVGLAARDGATVEAVYAFHPYLEAQYPFAGALPPYGPHGEGTQDPADPTSEP